jgi:hypothetical protein
MEPPTKPPAAEMHPAIDSQSKPAATDDGDDTSGPVELASAEAESEPFLANAASAAEKDVAPIIEVPSSPPPVRKEKKPMPRDEPENAPEPALVKPPPVRKQSFTHARQEVMQFEPVTRGRFEKSEPTIVEGQDLDVPTFLRKNVRVK